MGIHNPTKKREKKEDPFPPGLPPSHLEKTWFWDVGATIDWFWLPTFPMILVRGLSNKEVKFQNKGADPVQISSLFISQPRSQNQSIQIFSANTWKMRPKFEYHTPKCHDMATFRYLIKKFGKINSCTTENLPLYTKKLLKLVKNSQALTPPPASGFFIFFAWWIPNLST